VSNGALPSAAAAQPRAVVLYGSSYWNEIINFDALVRHGMINREDLALFQFADDPATAFGLNKASTAWCRSPNQGAPPR